MSLHEEPNESTAMMQETKPDEAPAESAGEKADELHVTLDVGDAGGEGDVYDSKTTTSKKKKTLSLPRPKVQGQHVRIYMDTPNDIQIRDPNSINEFAKVSFEDIIAEPDPTVFSFDKVWTLSFKIFTTTKLWVYRITSLICAIPASICWGIYFACLAFNTIWCWVPAIKGYEIECFVIRRVYEIILNTILGPLCDIVGRCFSHIIVTQKSG